VGRGCEERGGVKLRWREGGRGHKVEGGCDERWSVKWE
jgi:hypothetical protein